MHVVSKEDPMSLIIAAPGFLALRKQCFFPVVLTFLFFAGSAARSALGAAVADRGVIAGTVSNAGTGNLLEGARVELPGLRLTELTDNTGHYVFDGVPAGTHEIVATYSGLELQKATIAVGAGLRATRDFDLTSSVYVLDAFTVSGEREGMAAALTARRNADNVKNVVAMDEFGNLPNLNGTELAVRLPGVTFANPGDEVIESVSVRGMGAGMSTITIDGGLMSSFSPQNRQTRMTAFTGAMFESMEVIKGHTPEKSADSLGGTINFKTRSPLSMKEKRRFSYTISARQAPWFTEQVPLREAHRSHPLFSGSYQEKFRVAGSGEDNLAVSVHAFYSENVFGYFRAQRDYQQTNSAPAFLWDYRTMDNYNNRKQMSLATKWDYRLTPNSKLAINLIVYDAPEPKRRQYLVRAYAGSQTTVPSASTGIVPGWSDRITTVRAVPTASNATSSTAPAAMIDVTSTLMNRVQRFRNGDVSGEHQLGRLVFDWAALWSRMRYRTLGGDGILVNRIGGVPFIGPNGLAGSATNNIRGPNGETGVGWILDRTQSDLYPKFIQNGGLDFTNPANYRPTVNGLTSGNSGNLSQHLVRDARGNAKFQLPVDAFKVYLKAGGQVREQSVNVANNRIHRWSYIGTGALPTAPSVLLWDAVKTGRQIPVWDAAAFMRNGQPINPELWQEDRYYYESNKYIGTNEVKEIVTAGYVSTQGTFGQNGFLAGVRQETTDTKAWGWARERVASTAAQQLADPVGTAQRDYAGNLRKINGSYTQAFPSIHLYRNLTANLKGRLSWSTSFGRPSMANALPTETVNETNQTLTIGNPALLPQRAKNWDAALEYYFEPAGSLSVGWFHKSIRDYILTAQESGIVASGPDNGYDGEYAGFKTLTTTNAGTAIAQGWEISYQQQFRFLPGLLKGLSLNANLTRINTHGNFGGATNLTNNQVVGFVPTTSNVSLSWNHRKFGTRILYSYTSENLRAFNATQASRNQFMLAREMVNLGLTWQLRPNLTLQFDVANLFNSPLQYYRGIPDQMETFIMQGTTISAGVQGRF
jgi:TonB-dependent receptor